VTLPEKNQTGTAVSQHYLVLPVISTQPIYTCL